MDRIEEVADMDFAAFATITPEDCQGWIVINVVNEYNSVSYTSISSILEQILQIS